MRTKHFVVIAALAVAGWLAMSQISGVQAKYEDDITDYRSAVVGDSLPLQARMEKSRPTQQLIRIVKAVETFRADADNADVLDIAGANKTSLADQLITTAMRYLGVPYRSGQSSPKGFDCSGFTNYVFKQQNIALTRSSRSQYTEGAPVADVADLRKGDLVFFGGSRGSRSIGHVGIVTEVCPETRSFKFIHASRSSGIKVDDSKQAYYSRRYVGARRILQ